MPPSSSHISSPQNTPYKPSKHPPPPPSIIFKLGSSIMGVITYEMEVTSSIPPAKMFKASNVEIIQGDGGPGTIKKIYFGEGSQFKSVTHRVDGIDKENFTYSYSIIEGDALMGILESISYEVKLVASPDGGSICKNISKYHTKDDAVIDEEQIKAGKEKASGMFKAIEAYLLANPMLIKQYIIEILLVSCVSLYLYIYW
ncbi:hypothetical protein AAG906_027648 [Vitis piasezkii]